MDSNQVQTAASSSAMPANVNSPAQTEDSSSSESGFARLFSLIQSKAEKLINSDATPPEGGKNPPELGKNSPLKLGLINQQPASNTVLPNTAVLSTTAERTNPLLDTEENLILPVEGKIKRDASGDQKVPFINLPSVNRDTSETTSPLNGLTDPEDAIIEIPPAEKISFQSNEQVQPDQSQSIQVKTIPDTIESVGKITKNKETYISNPFTNSEEQSALATKVSNKVHFNNTPFGESSDVKQSFGTNQNLNQFSTLANSGSAQVMEKQATIIDSQISAGKERLAGISDLVHDLKGGRYNSATEISLPTAATSMPDNEDIIAKLDQRIQQSPQPSPQQVQMSPLEIRTVQNQAGQPEQPIVEAAYQRQLETKPEPATTYPLNEQVSKAANTIDRQRQDAIAEQQARMNTLEKNQSFESLWEKARPASELFTKQGLEQNSASRPVRELVNPVMENILPAGAVDTSLGSKSSMATQPLFSTSGSASGMPSPSINIRQGGWETSLARNVSWMASQDLKTIQVNISPAELGPINIQASMEKDQLSLQINAQHGVTRETLEAAIPKLRDLLSEGNFSSVNVDVSSGGQSQQQFSENEHGGEMLSTDQLDELSSLQQTASIQTASKVGLVDMFA